MGSSSLFLQDTEARTSVCEFRDTVMLSLQRHVKHQPLIAQKMTLFGSRVIAAVMS